MLTRMPKGVHRTWLAARVWRLLEQKYGPGNVPAVRKISADIREVNHGETISHAHISAILNGEANNLTSTKRNLLARFFGGHPSILDAPNGEPESPIAIESTAELAFRFATFEPEQIAAIEEALEIVKRSIEKE